MRVFKFFLALALLVGQDSLVATHPQSSPVRIALGDSVVDARRIQPYDNAFVVTIYEDGKAMSPGIWTDQVRVREAAGRTAMVRTQGLAYFDGRYLGSVNAFDRVTAAPISDFQHKRDGKTEVWTFDGAYIKGTLSDKPGGNESLSARCSGIQERVPDRWRFRTLSSHALACRGGRRERNAARCARQERPGYVDRQLATATKAASEGAPFM
jgi:hypothetical protein